jgi:hypothetical protein
MLTDVSLADAVIESLSHDPWLPCQEADQARPPLRYPNARTEDKADSLPTPSDP